MNSNTYVHNHDSFQIKAAADLALSVLPHAAALNQNEIQRGIQQCKEESDTMLEKACEAVEKAARGGGVYPDVMFEVAKHWYDLYNKNLPSLGNAMATPPPQAPPPSAAAAPSGPEALMAMAAAGGGPYPMPFPAVYGLIPGFQVSFVMSILLFVICVPFLAWCSLEVPFNTKYSAPPNQFTLYFTLPQKSAALLALL